MIAIGIILLLIGFLTGIPVIWTIGMPVRKPMMSRMSPMAIMISPSGSA